jgi:hypothetical protein
MKFLGALVGILGAGAHEIRTVQVSTGLNGLTDIQNAVDGSGRLFFVQQSRLIRVMRNGALLTTSFSSGLAPGLTGVYQVNFQVVSS